jgi:DNA-binding MarR family transcriptional regulator
MSYANDMVDLMERPRVVGDAALASELRHAVMRLRRRLAVERHPDNELSLPQMTVLGTLHRLGDITLGELAAHEMVQPPSMTRTVNCLEDGGYVVRRKHDTDGRQVVVSLSQKGRATLMADRRRRDAWLARRLKTLTAEERELLLAATPLLASISEED